MNKLIRVVFLGVLFLTACEYDVPLTIDHSIPINRTILGDWEAVAAEDGDHTNIRILEFSDTEYLVHYYADDGDLYFRAYAINVGGVSAVQLELIGDDKGSVDKHHENRYHVVAYKIVDGMLEISTLNTELVSTDLSDSESLETALIANKESPELFNDPGLYKRSAD